MVNRVTKKSFMVSFREWGSTALWLVQPLRGSRLLINLGRIKSRVDLGPFCGLVHGTPGNLAP